jgi:hypothetical protein
MTEVELGWAGDRDFMGKTGRWKREVMRRIMPCLVLMSLRLCAQQPQATLQTSPMKVEQIVQTLVEKNRERAAALHQFQGTRVYRMEYRGFPGSRDAELVVTMHYQAPNTKTFTVVSQTGSKLIIDRVFKKLLESEQEAMNEENRQQTALTPENYDFTLAGVETTSDGVRFVLNTIPKSKNKFLYQGKIWVDANDFAVVKIEAVPAKNPSFWIKKTEIRHRYMKVADFWLPAENRSESQVRLGGRAVLSIEYKDYKIQEATPLHAVQSGHGNASAAAAVEMSGASLSLVGRP